MFADMNKNQIIKLQERIGTTPDGFWGPQSVAACQRHLRAMMPKPNPWPKQTQAALQAFYGSPATNLSSLSVVGLGVAYKGGTVNTIAVHRRCSASLLRIIEALSRSPFAYVLRQYAGVFNNRPMRGGSLPSLHARAAAIDLMPATNGNRTHWPTSSNMPIEVMEIFAREGWLAAGAFWSRDAMHFQATQ
jgi:hypothetical protein